MWPILLLNQANEIYVEQLKVDQAAGKLSVEKSNELNSGNPHLSASFINTFLHRNPDLHVKSSRSVAATH
jgi:hypothetical protein